MEVTRYLLQVVIDIAWGSITQKISYTFHLKNLLHFDDKSSSILHSRIIVVQTPVSLANINYERSFSNASLQTFTKSEEFITFSSPYIATTAINLAAKGKDMYIR